MVLRGGDLSTFVVEIDATFYVAGPFPIHGSACTAGIACVVTFSGVELAGTSSARVGIGACGTERDTVLGVPAVAVGPHTSAAVYTFATPDPLEVGSGYVLCWAQAPAEAPDFSVQVDGNFLIAGPRTGSYGCTFGVPCTVMVDGYGFASTNTLLLSAEPCGTVVLAPEVWAGVTNPVSLGELSLFDIFFFGTPLSGSYGGYSLCWAYAAGGLADHRVTVDAAFSMHGLASEDHACTLGLICRIELRGAGLAPTNRLLISSTECVSGGARAVIGDRLSNPRASELGSTASIATYVFGAPNADVAGTHHLCWAFNPSSTADYIVGVGATFTLTGAFPGSFNCTAGIICAVTLSGVELADSSRVLIGGSACGAAVQDFVLGIPLVSVAPDASHAVYNFVTPAAADVDDSYVMCWGHSPSDASDYVVQVVAHPHSQCQSHPSCGDLETIDFL